MNKARRKNISNKVKYEGSKVDLSVGFISGIYIQFKDSSKIPIFDNFSFVSRKDDNYKKLIEEIEKEKPLQNGVFLTYELPKEIAVKTYFELFDKLENIARAIQFMKDSDCEYVFHVDCYNKKLYEPSMDFSKSRSRNPIIEITKKDFKKISELFKKLEKLKLQDFSEYSRLKNAINFYDKACFDGGHLSSLINFFISLESLFSDDEKTEIAYKIRLRASYLNYPHKKQSEKRRDIFNVIKEGYEIRSLFLHGGDVESNNKIKKKGSYSYFEEYLPKIKNIARSTIKKILLNEDHYLFFSNDKKNRSKTITSYLDLTR